MKQKVAHLGATIDTATPGEVADIVAQAFARERNQSYRRIKGVIPLDGSGAGVGTESTSRLYDWILERVTLTAGANAVFSLYENQQAPSDLMEVVGLGAAGVYSDAFSNTLFVPAGSTLVIAVAGGGANGQATYNLQSKLIRAM